jgi:Second Messenger Oligonucleotide or Dinucleotide Synthetase domain
MANCNNIFEVYNSNIRLGDSDREILKQVRNKLREKMNIRFKYLPDITSHELEFQSQGSFIMDTIIKPHDDDFDLDDGVYFIGHLTPEKRPAPQIFHDWVKYTVGEDENYAEVTDKETCVRVRYVKEKFHIDLPIYYASKKHPELAHTKKGWTLSNPIDFIAWFEEKVESGFKKEFLLEKKTFSAEYKNWLSDIRKKDAQLRRIVRYLKGWGDELRGEMPPGIVMTILAGNNYVANVRDDVSLKNTLIQIKQYLASNGFKCPRPTAPIGEDLFAEYSQTKKDYFLARLNTFIDSATQAVAHPNQKDACMKWQYHLGRRFPCSIAKDEIEGANTYSSPAVIGATAKSA